MPRRLVRDAIRAGTENGFTEDQIRKGCHHQARSIGRLRCCNSASSLGRSRSTRLFEMALIV